MRQLVILLAIMAIPPTNDQISAQEIGKPRIAPPVRNGIRELGQTVMPTIAAESSEQQSGFRFRAQPLADWKDPELFSKFSSIEGKFALASDLPIADINRYERLMRLQPIEAHFFPLPETVCFPDGRTQILDTMQAPYSANCQLIMNLAGGGQAIGTGWLVGKRLVITAGHCVHEGQGGAFYTSVEVIPGMNGPLRPYGSQVCTKLRASDAWKTSGAIAQDYGAILLDFEFQSTTGAVPGYHKVSVRNDADLSGAAIHLSGYPADKTFGSQWGETEPLTAAEAARLKYMLDTFGGQSGSAVLLDATREVVGIHNYGGCPNYCTRITASVKADLDTWLGESTAGSP